MQPSDLTALVSVADPQLSPDGRHVAYVLNRIDGDANKYTSQIWVVSTDGSAPPRALTAGEHRDAQPRWSPDGRVIAFGSTRKKDDKGKTKSTLHVLPFEVPGETALLAEGNEAFSDLAFSPDGTMLAVTHRVRGEHYDSDDIADRPPRKIESYFTKLNGEGFVVDRPRHVHIVPVDGSGPIRDVTPGAAECSSASWLPDNKRMVVSVNRFNSSYTVDAGIVSAQIEPDTTEVTPELLTDSTGVYTTPVVSPDGSQVLVLGFDDSTIVPQNVHLGLLDTDAAGPSTPDWRSRTVDRTWAPTTGASSPQFIGDTTVLATHEDRGNTHLVQLDLVSGEVEYVVDGDLNVTGASAGTVDGSPAVAYTATTATAPAELFLAIEGASTVQLTDHGHSFVARVEPQAPEHFLAGPADVDAWIVLPYDFDPSQKYPMLLNIHGGPFTQYGNYFFDEFQMQARAGYVVVYSNPRGGSGRTEEWAQTILGPKHPKVAGTGWGSVDYDDCIAVVDQALARYDFIDPERVGVLGGSYGGYMTSWIVTHDDRFAAACTERAANNLLSLEYASDIGGFFFAEVGPKFVDDPDEYLRMSPISYVKDLNTPLLIIHSEEDLRCPEDQAWQLFNMCVMLDKPDVEFWLFPGETHELSRSGSPKHRAQRQDIITEFFDRFLK